MYSDDLTTGEIADNFAAGLPNSVPVAPNAEFIFTGDCLGFKSGFQRVSEFMFDGLICFVLMDDRFEAC